jgi:hypothetical protein
VIAVLVVVVVEIYQTNGIIMILFKKNELKIKFVRANKTNDLLLCLFAGTRKRELNEVD